MCPILNGHLKLILRKCVAIDRTAEKNACLAWRTNKKYTKKKKKKITHHKVYELIWSLYFQHAQMANSSVRTISASLTTIAVTEKRHAETGVMNATAVSTNIWARFLSFTPGLLWAYSEYQAQVLLKFCSGFTRSLLHWSKLRVKPE